MPAVERSALVNFSAAAMYALVEDIEAYPQFLPWCGGTEVHRRDATHTEATIRVDYRGVRQQFTTENAKIPGERIVMRLIRGPFKELEGVWTFTPLTEGACKVHLQLRYILASTLLEKLTGPVFHYIADSFVDAFVRRAESLQAVR